MSHTRWSSLAPFLLLLACANESSGAAAQAPALAGRWTHTSDGMTAQLDLADAGAGRMTGTFSLGDASAALEGQARGSLLVISSLGGIPASAENGTVIGNLNGNVLTLTVVQPGVAPVTIPMTRTGAPPPAEAGSGDRVAAPREPAGRATIDAFAGRWESVSDDGTSSEVIELAADGNAVSGTLTASETGYFSGRTTITGEIALSGRLERGALVIEARDVTEGAAAAPVAGRATRRGEFLVLRIGNGESSFGRPGVALVESAEHSAEAVALARTITGRIYAAGSGAGGRGGYVGGRVRIAFCADGSMAYDASDVASLPDGAGGGSDMGSTRTRRGTWGIVLRAGAPTVRAQWEGSGSSYSLTEYFQVRAAPGGATAVIDGRELPFSGNC
jgi:hypothetical protein